MTVWFAPATPENVKTSIDNTVPWECIERYLTKAEVRHLRNESNADGVHCWAMTKGRKSLFDTMEVGDEVLITPRGEGLFTRYGQVYLKTTNAPFGIEVWPDAGKDPWEHVFFLRNIHKVKLDKRDVLREAGYNDPKDMLYGIRAIKDEHLKMFLKGSSSLSQKLGLHDSLNSQMLQPTSDPTTFDERVSSIQKLGNIPMPKGVAIPQFEMNSRKEFLRDPAVKAWIKMNAKGNCEICLNPAPFNDVEGLPYLEVHHVHTLGDGGSDTVNNTVALCPNCHRLLHYGNGHEVAKAKDKINSIERIY